MMEALLYSFCNDEKLFATCIPQKKPNTISPPTLRTRACFIGVPFLCDLCWVCYMDHVGHFLNTHSSLFLGSGRFIALWPFLNFCGPTATAAAVFLSTMPWTVGSMAARQPMDSNSNPPGYEQPMEGHPDNLQTRAPIRLAMGHLSPSIVNKSNGWVFSVFGFGLSIVTSGSN